MPRSRDPKAIQRFDTTKFLVLIALIALFTLLFATRGCQNLGDGLGNGSTPVPTYTFDLAVVRPIMIAPIGSQALITDTVMLIGSGAPNSRLQLLRNGATVDTVTVDAEGKWQSVVTIAESGQYEFIAQALDSNNNVLIATSPLTLAIAVPTATATPIPTVTPIPTATPVPTNTPLPTVTPAPPTATPRAPLAVNSLVLDMVAQPNVLRMEGEGNPGVVAQLLANQTVVNTTTVDATGLWSMITPLENPDQYQIGLNALLTDGQQIAVTVPMQNLAIALPTVTETPTNVPTAAPTSVAPTVGEFVFARGVNTNTVTFAGSGEPGALLQVLLDNTIVATTTVDTDGAWTVVANLDAPRDYNVTVQTLLADGSLVTAVAPLKLIVAAAAVTESATEIAPVTAIEPAVAATATRIPPSLTISPSTIQVGDTIQLSGRGVPGELIEVIAGGNVVGSTTVQPDGSYTYALRFTSPGIQYLGVRAIDAAGTVVVGRTFAYVVVNPTAIATATETATTSATNTPVPTTTNTVAPTTTESATPIPTNTKAPTATYTVVPTATTTTAPTETATTTPTESATATATATVEPTATDTPVPTATATTAPTATNTVTTVPTETATSTATPTASATGTATLLPTATRVLPSFQLSSLALQVGEHLTLTGTAAPGETVEVIVGGTVIDSTTADADGVYGFDLSFAAPGLQSIVVRALDARGNPVLGTTFAYVVVNPQ